MKNVRIYDRKKWLNNEIQVDYPDNELTIIVDNEWICIDAVITCTYGRTAIKRFFNSIPDEFKDDIKGWNECMLATYDNIGCFQICEKQKFLNQIDAIDYGKFYINLTLKK